MNFRKTPSACLLLLVAACGAETDEPGGPGQAVEPVSHQQAALLIATNTETALMGVTNAGAFIADSEAVAGAMSELGSSTTCTSSEAVSACAPDGTCTAPTATSEPECVTDEVTTEDLHETHADIRSGIGDIVEQLRTLFTEDNIEQAEEKAVTYLLGPDDLCSEIETLNADGSVTTSGYDPECVDEVTQLALRLRVTSPSEGNVDVTVQLTQQRYEPFVFELHQGRLAATADLDQLTASLEAAGEELEELESLTGRLQIELVENAPLDYSARLNVLDEVALVVVDEDGRMEASLGASSPTTEVRIDGNARTISATYDYGPVRLSGPLAMFADGLGDGSDSSSDSAVAIGGSDDIAQPVPLEPVPVEPEPVKVYTGVIEVLLAGLDGSFTFAGATDSFTFSGLGLGDQTSTLKHDGNTVIAVDVNADQGRHFDLTIEDTSTGLQMTFSPTLDISVLLAFSHLADQIDVPSTLMNDTLRLWFEGSNPSLLVTDNGLQVASGTLHLSSSAHPEYDVTVQAGMCLLGEKEPAPVATVQATPALPADPPAPAPEPVTIEEEQAEEHAFSALEVGTCQ